MNTIFKTHPSASLARDFYVSSSRTSGMRIHMDPPQRGKYWRSIVGNLNLLATQWRASAR